MVQVYVSEMPETADKCPFYGRSNKKCSITNEKCCMEKKIECKHLITLRFGFAEDDYAKEDE